MIDKNRRICCINAKLSWEKGKNTPRYHYNSPQLNIGISVERQFCLTTPQRWDRLEWDLF